MKILILTNNFRGLYNFRKEVVKALLDQKYCVTISAPFDEKKDFFEDIGCQLVDTQFNRKGMNPIKDLALLLRYRKLLIKIRPDLVLSYTIKPNIYGGVVCQFLGIPQMANVTGLGSAVEKPGLLQKLTILMYKVGLRKTRVVFFQNIANMEFCKSRGMVKGRNVLLPGSGVNLIYHNLMKYPSEDAGIRFIFISRLLKEKGIEEYLYAAEYIKKKYPFTEFHVLGASEEAYEKKLELFQSEGIVIYHGHQSDVRPYIANSHCTVHPSYYPEGMSNVLLESCAAGRPIITTGRPGCGELVDEGVNGYIVQQCDGYDVAQKIERFLSIPYERKKEMGLASRKKVEREFDRQIVINAYLKEIESLSNV